MVVIAGFPGVDRNNNITTLGRGGSDTSAVAIAAAIALMNVESIQTFVEYILPIRVLFLMRENSMLLLMKKC